MQVNYNPYYILFGGISIILSLLRKPSKMTLTLVLGLLTLANAVIIVALLAMTIAGTSTVGNAGICCTLKLTEACRVVLQSCLSHIHQLEGYRHVCHAAVQHRHGKQNWGSIEGHSEDPSDKVFDVFKSLGTVAFAFAFADRIPKIQVTFTPSPVCSRR